MNKYYIFTYYAALTALRKEVHALKIWEECRDPSWDADEATLPQDLCNNDCHCDGERVCVNYACVGEARPTIPEPKDEREVSACEYWGFEDITECLTWWSYDGLCQPDIQTVEEYLVCEETVYNSITEVYTACQWYD
jgi:hypothetical protein